MSYEEIGIRLKAEGQAEAAAGMNAGAAAAERLGQAAGRAAPQMDNLARTTKQTRQAMQQLPMQITDVVTSLSTGMPVWMIAIQQGGQIRDAFGGIRPAAQALTSTLTPLRLAVGGTATAMGVLTAAYVAGRREQNEFLRNILLTGNAASTTAGQLAEMARRQAAVAGTQGQASGVLASLVGTGQVSRAQLGIATEAAIGLQRSLAVEAENTVRAFAELGRDPVAAAAKLNEQTNFLTASTWEQIRALVEQKRTAEAAAVAQEAYARAGIQRTQEMERNLGLLERGWRSLGETARRAWDFMLNVGRQNTVEQELADVQARLQAPVRRGVDPTQAAARREALRQREAELQEQLRIERRAADVQSTRAAAVRAQVAADTARPGRTAAGPRGPSNAEILRSRAVNSVAAFRAFEAEGYAATDRFLFEQAEAERQAARRRQDQAEDYLQQLLDANRRTSAELIGDARQRGEALIQLERDQALRRLAELQVGGDEEARVRAQIDQRSMLARQKLEQGLREDDQRRTQELARSIEDGLMNGFRAGRSWSDIFLSELKAQFARTILRPQIEIVAAKTQNSVSQLLGLAGSFLGGLFGGGSSGNGAGGGPFNDGSVVPGFDRPLEGFHGGGIAGGTPTFRRRIPRYHAGAIAGDEVPAVLRRKEGIFTEEQMKALAPVEKTAPKAVITFAPQISIDSRTDRAEVMGLVMRAMEASKASLQDEMARRLR